MLWNYESLIKKQTRHKGLKHAYLQQAGASGEAQSERLTADVKGLRVGQLWADRKWVPSSGSNASAWEP